jgi:hypothetical protein
LTCQSEKRLFSWLFSILNLVSEILYLFYILSIFSFLTKNNLLANDNPAEIEEQLKALNEFYKRALLYELDLNGRDEYFLRGFERVRLKFLYL